MFGVIANPNHYEDIKNVIKEQILFEKIGVLDYEEVANTLQKAEAVTLNTLVIDMAAIKEEAEQALVKALDKYRIRQDKTRIIILAPGRIPGDETMGNIAFLGIGDIVAPKLPEIEENEDEEEYSIDLGFYLEEQLFKTVSYPDIRRWRITADLQQAASEEATSKEAKPKVKIEYLEVVESVFKEVITVYSPTSEGVSRIAAHLAHSIAASKECKVLLIDFNVLKPIQRELFEVKSDFTLKDTFDSVIKRTLTPAVLENFTIKSKENKNLDILVGLYDINEYYESQQIYYQEIIEKAKFSYDYVVIDTHSCYDLYPTHAALLMADHILMPVRGRKHSIETINRYLDSFREYDDYDIRKFNLIINQYSGEDLTSIEIQSKTDYSIIGYISNFKEYDVSNGFKNKKIMNEYVDILNSIGIRAKKKTRIWDKFKFSKKKKQKKQGDA